MIESGTMVVIQTEPGCGGELQWHGAGPWLGGHVGFVDVVDPTQEEDTAEHKTCVIVHGCAQWFRPSELHTPDGNIMDDAGPVMPREQAGP